jgi:hypothetical protein
MRIGIPAMAKIFSQISDQYTTVQEQENEFVYTIHRCPVCWGRSGSDKPVCFVAVGLLQEGLKWLSGGNEFRVNESKCIAMGEPVCEFERRLAENAVEDLRLVHEPSCPLCLPVKAAAAAWTIISYSGELSCRKQTNHPGC